MNKLTTALLGILIGTGSAMAAKPIVLPTPTIIGIEVTLTFSTTRGYLLTLQTSTDLESWTTIATATPSSDVWTFVHDTAPATEPTRFYRALFNP